MMQLSDGTRETVSRGIVSGDRALRQCLLAGNTSRSAQGCINTKLVIGLVSAALTILPWSWFRGQQGERFSRRQLMQGKFVHVLGRNHPAADSPK
jgi:hypothetical protein